MPRPHNDDWSKWVYFGLYILWLLIIAIVVTIFDVALWGHTFVFHGHNLNEGFLLLIVHLIYIGSSIRQVPPGKIAALIFLGKPIWNFTSGMIIAPPIVSWIVFASRNIIQVEIGTPITNEAGQVIEVQAPENVDVYVSNEPLRVTFADWQTADYSGFDITDPNNPNGPPLHVRDPFTKESQDPLHRARMTADPHVTCQWQIDDLCTVLEEVGTNDIGLNPSDYESLMRKSPTDQANFLIDRHLRSALQRTTSRFTPAQVLFRLPHTSEELTNDVEWLVGEPGAKPPPGSTPAAILRRRPYWGINIRTVEVPTLGLPKRVNIAMANNAKQGPYNERRVSRSQAMEVERRNLGRGDADALGMKREADVAGVLKLGKKLSSRSEIVRKGHREAAKIEAAKIGMASSKQLIMAPPNVLNVIGSPFADNAQRDVPNVPQLPQPNQPPQAAPPQQQNQPAGGGGGGGGGGGAARRQRGQARRQRNQQAGGQQQNAQQNQQNPQQQNQNAAGGQPQANPGNQGGNAGGNPGNAGGAAGNAGGNPGNGVI